MVKTVLDPELHF